MIISRNNYEAFFLDYIEGNLRADLHEELQLFLQKNPDLAAELDEMKSFNEINHFTNTADEIIFSDKEFLKKEESSKEENLMDELLAKELEGDLTKEENALLQKIALGSSVVEKWRRLYSLTKLKSGSEIFSDKDVVRIPENIDHSSIHELLIAHCEGDLTEEENLMLESILASDSSLRTELSLYSLTRLNAEAIVYPHKASLYRKETIVVPLRRRVYASVAAAAAIALLITWINYSDTSSALSASRFSSIVEAPTVNVSSEVSIKNASSNDLAMKREPTKAFEQPKRDNALQREISQVELAQNSDVVEPTHIAIESMSYLDIATLEVAPHKGLQYDFPEMKKLYEQPLPNQVASQESITLLAFLGKAASSKIMGSEAYIYTERQMQRVSGKFQLERTPIENKDALFLKIGSLEFEKRVARKENNLIERVKNILPNKKKD